MPGCVERAVERLGALGHEAYIVGGCVRDSLLGRAPKDWDVTTDAPPERIAEAFGDYRCLSHAEKYGTVTVVFDEMPVEITTYRIDGGYSDNRRPDTVAYTASLREDLRRRDFTINALAYRHDAGVVDYFGGRRDLADGLIRCVGDARERFGEDALRILRALRFASRYDFCIEEGAAAAIHALCRTLGGIAQERVCAELTGILTGNDAGGLFAEYPDVLCLCVPELRKAWEGGRLARALAAVRRAPPELAVRLALLLREAVSAEAAAAKNAAFTENTVTAENGGPAEDADTAENAAQILRRLRFDGGLIDTVKALLRNFDAPIPTDAPAVKRRLNRLGEGRFLLLLAVRRASVDPDGAACGAAQSDPASGPAQSGGAELSPAERLAKIDRAAALVSEILARGDCFSLKGLKVNGEKLKALGYAPGRKLGAALETLLESVIAGGCPNEEQALAAMAERLLNRDCDLRD
jgi:tRNA nucleotidyltransferase (CCA-adding enzyme)